jgi:hypothetical protein
MWFRVGETTRGNNDTSGTPDQTARFFSEPPATVLSLFLQPRFSHQMLSNAPIRKQWVRPQGLIV